MRLTIKHGKCTISRDLLVFFFYHWRWELIPVSCWCEGECELVPCSLLKKKPTNFYQKTKISLPTEVVVSERLAIILISMAVT